MKKYLTQIIIIFLSTLLISCGDNVYEIYISPHGNDNASGKISDPIKSLNHAAKLASLQAGKVPVNIYLSGGFYRLTEPLKLGISDGGNEEAPVVWQAVKGEKPVISGGITIKNWMKEDDGSWSAPLPENYQGKFRSFYINGNRGVRARFPDKDYLQVEMAGKDNRTSFFFKADDFPKVESANMLELVFLHDWSITRIAVKSIDWKSRCLFPVDSIGARNFSFFSITNWEERPRYYLENAKEYCDKPGEWFCDFENRRIYYRPFPGDNINETEGVIPLTSQLLTIIGNEDKRAGFISFKGITFEHTSWEIPERGYCGIQACMFDDREGNGKHWDRVPAAVELKLTENCTFRNCVIRQTGGSGILIGSNCSNCEIIESHIYDISGNGIEIGEGQHRPVNGDPWWKSAPEQVAINNAVTLSLIEDCGQQFYEAVGIWCGLVANTLLDHNEVRYLPYTGISVGWMWDTTATPCRENITNANHIHHVMQTLSDGGGIYNLGLQPGSRITKNLIHDVSVNAGRAESNGMFLDEGIKDLLVKDNIVYKIARSPLRFHKAFRNVVRDNVFACADDIPPIRYNRTKEEDIIKIDNIILRESSEKDIGTLDDIIKKSIGEIGHGRNYEKTN